MLQRKKPTIEPLPAMNHAEIEYDDFDKDFYNVHKDVAAMSEEEVISDIHFTLLRFASHSLCNLPVVSGL